MDRGAWQVTVHGGHKESDTTEQLNNNKDMPVCRCREMCACARTHTHTHTTHTHYTHTHTHTHTHYTELTIKHNSGSE